MFKAKLLSISLVEMVALAFAVSCSEPSRDTVEQERKPDAALSVFVNIPPQAYFVDRIGGDEVKVEILVPAGREPHDFSPSPRIIMALGKADIYFHGRIPFGLGLAERVKDADTAAKIVDITEGINFRKIDDPTHHDHDHGHAHDHSHHPEGKDPHVWLGPPEIKIQAENISEALKKADPERSDEYAANLAEFLSEIDKVHLALQETLKPYRGETFYVYHPAFGYFCRAYNLNQRAVETGGRSPSPKHLRSLIQQARQDNVRVIFTQPQFEGRSVEAVAEAIDGAVVPLDPLAYDVLDNLIRISEQLQQAMAENE